MPSNRVLVEEFTKLSRCPAKASHQASSRASRSLHKPCQSFAVVLATSLSLGAPNQPGWCQAPSGRAFKSSSWSSPPMRRLMQAIWVMSLPRLDLGGFVFVFFHLAIAVRNFRKRRTGRSSARTEGTGPLREARKHKTRVDSTNPAWQAVAAHVVIPVAVTVLLAQCSFSAAQITYASLRFTTKRSNVFMSRTQPGKCRGCIAARRWARDREVEGPASQVVRARVHKHAYTVQLLVRSLRDSTSFFYLYK